ncbi:MAG TPA: response regulator transcription factor [Kiritimatiellia bacterium]|nr:response regulator transcription factor [Kiritimatiellia bacterium]
MNADPHDQDKKPAIIAVLSDHASHARAVQQAVGSPSSVFSIKTGMEMAIQSHPTLAIIDAQAANSDPLQTLKHIRALLPNTRLILITSQPDPAIASRAMRSGASAYLSSDEVRPLLSDAVGKILAGERFVSENVMQGILHGMSEVNESEQNLRVESLSDREMMIFQLLGKGGAISEIARQLNINIKTVSTHCHNMRAKLGIRDNAELARISSEWMKNRAGNTPASPSMVAYGKP